MFKWLMDRGVPDTLVGLAIRPLVLGAVGSLVDAGLLGGRAAELLAALFG